MEESKIINGEFIPFFMAPPRQSHLWGLNKAFNTVNIYTPRPPQHLAGHPSL